MTTRTTRTSTTKKPARYPTGPVSIATAAAQAIDAHVDEQQEDIASAGQLNAIEAFFEVADAVNLDEVVPEPIHVPLKEYVDYTVDDPDTRQPLRRRKLRQRVAEIETYVPLDVYDKMLAARTRLQAQLAGATDEGERGRLALAWMVKPVLDVWCLTEPDMTEERLRLGLSLGQVQGLFGRFFGREMRRLTSRAESGASGTNGNASSRTSG